MTAFGATTVQGPLSAGGGHSGAEAANATSFALSPFEGAFHEGDLLTSRALEYCGEDYYPCKKRISIYCKKSLCKSFDTLG